jgi:endoglucanase
MHTNGAQLEDAHARVVRLTGVNWFGMETCSYAPHGLWSRNWRDMMVQIRSLGFNTIRLPFSNQLFDSVSQPNGIDYQLNPDLKGLTGLQIMDKIVAEARVLGLKVILDRHRPDCGAQSPLWYTDHYSEARWISDWVMLARRYAGNDAVIGADLHNEPHERATWGDGNLATDWRLAAERAGNAVLRANSNWLIFVEGIEHVGPTDYYWWGGNLAAARTAPVRLTTPHRLVYEAHDYGPEVWGQQWFSDPSFPANLASVWNAHWGYLQQQNIAPVLVGEFGGVAVDSGKEGQWIHTLVQFIQSRGLSFTYWSMNPDSGDTGGLLNDDWTTVNQAKIALLRSAMAPTIDLPEGRPATPPGPPPPTPPKRPAVSRRAVSAPQQHAATGGIVVLYDNGKLDPVSNNPSPNIQIVNTSSTSIPLADLEARYYFNADNLHGQTQILDVDWASIGASNVQGSFVHLTGDAYYLQLHFSPAAGQLAPRGGNAEIKMRIHKPDWSAYNQGEDYSFGSAIFYTAWPRIPLFEARRLIWGEVPR